jgi:hypothetical protein
MVAVGDEIILARMPGYLAGWAQETSDSSTFTTTETVVGTVTASVISSVVYLLQCDLKIGTTVADDLVSIKLREDNVSGTQIQGSSDIIPRSGSNNSATFPLRARWTASSTGSKTFVATAQRVGGTGNLSRDVLSVLPQLFTVIVAG